MAHDIKKGDIFLCINSLFSITGDKRKYYYRSFHYYISEQDGCITNIQGNKNNRFKGFLCDMYFKFIRNKPTFKPFLKGFNYLVDNHIELSTSIYFNKYSYKIIDYYTNKKILSDKLFDNEEIAIHCGFQKSKEIIYNRKNTIFHL